MNKQRLITWGIYLGIGYFLSIVFCTNHQISQVAVVIALIVAGCNYLSGKSPVGAMKFLSGLGYMIFVAVLVRLFLGVVAGLPLFEFGLLKGADGGVEYSLRYPGGSLAQCLLWELACLGVVLGIVIAMLYNGVQAQVRVARVIFYCCIFALVGRVLMFNPSFRHLAQAAFSYSQSATSELAVVLENKSKIKANLVRENRKRGDKLPTRQLARDVVLLNEEWQYCGSLKQDEWVKVDFAAGLPDNPNRTSEKFVFIGREDATGFWKIYGYVPITAIKEPEPEPPIPVQNVQASATTATCQPSVRPVAQGWYVDSEDETKVVMAVNLAPGDQSEQWHFRARGIQSYRIFCSKQVPCLIDVNGQQLYSPDGVQLDLPHVYNVGRVSVRIPLTDRNGNTITHGAVVKLYLNKEV